MNAPSWLLHLSSHLSLPPFSLLTSGYARMPAAYRPARYATAARHALATQPLRLPQRNLFGQYPMEMWAHGRWRHRGSFWGFSLSRVTEMWECEHTGEEIPAGIEWAGNELQVAQPGLMKMILRWLLSSPIWMTLTHAAPPVWTCCWAGRSAPAEPRGINPTKPKIHPSGFIPFFDITCVPTACS